VNFWHHFHAALPVIAYDAQITPQAFTEFGAALPFHEVARKVIAASFQDGSVSVKLLQFLSYQRVMLFSSNNDFNVGVLSVSSNQIG